MVDIAIAIGIEIDAMAVFVDFDSDPDTVGWLLNKGLPQRQIIRRLDRWQDGFVRFVPMGNASFANLVRSAIRAA